MGASDPPPAFDYGAYLDFLERHHHNFIRLWRWELPKWTERRATQTRYCAPHPWARVGVGQAFDGKPKFDLTQFDDAYFRRLRERVEAAGQRGIHVSIMLFEGWGPQYVPGGWKAHPFHPDNNVNGIDPDTNHDGKGLEIYTLAEPGIIRLEEDYVRRVVDTVNDLDNVLYEISNENFLGSTEWQYRLIRFVREYEKTKLKQHPIGMTSDGYGGNDDTDRLFQSPADWISPSPDRDDYKANPPVASGAKVIILDTDHLWGVGGTQDWVWKSFLRGHNPIWMDPYDRLSLWEPAPDNAERTRRSLGEARHFAERLNLANAIPHPEVSSTGYCLAEPGVEYLVYQPASGEAFSLDLKPGVYHYEWFNPLLGTTVAKGDWIRSGGREQLQAPFEGSAVFYMKTKEKRPR